MPIPNVNKRKKKMEAKRSGLDNVIEEIVWEGGCKKGKAELNETNLNNIEDRLEKYAELYDKAVGTLPESEQEEA